MVIFAQAAPHLEPVPPQSLQGSIERLTNYLLQPGVFEPLLGTVAVIAVIVGWLHYRRERWIRHQERLAMIQAGIHPDFPGDSPGEESAGLSTNSTHRPAVKALTETTGYRPM